jgi:hypothetical protein
MKNGGGGGGSTENGFDTKMMAKIYAIEIVFKSWGSFRIYQLISQANPAQFHSKRAELDVLISW